MIIFDTTGYIVDAFLICFSFYLLMKGVEVLATKLISPFLDWIGDIR